MLNVRKTLQVLLSRTESLILKSISERALYGFGSFDAV